MNGASESSGRKTQLNTRRLFGIGFIIFGLLAGTVFIVAIISQPNRQMMSESAILRQSQQPILPSADSLALSASEAIGFQSNVSSNEAELRVSQLQLTNTPLETQAQSGNHTAGNHRAIFGQCVQHLSFRCYGSVL